MSRLVVFILFILFANSTFSKEIYSEENIYKLYLQLKKQGVDVDVFASGKPKSVAINNSEFAFFYDSHSDRFVIQSLINFLHCKVADNMMKELRVLWGNLDEKGPILVDFNSKNILTLLKGVDSHELFKDLNSKSCKLNKITEQAIAFSNSVTGDYLGTPIIISHLKNLGSGMTSVITTKSVSFNEILLILDCWPKSKVYSVSFRQGIVFFFGESSYLCSYAPGFVAKCKLKKEGQIKTEVNSVAIKSGFALKGVAYLNEKYSDLISKVILDNERNIASIIRFCDD